MRMLARNEFGHHDPLVFALMCQHGAAHHISHGVDAGLAGAAIVVHRNKSSLINGKANLIELQILCVRHAADGDNEPIAIKCLGLAVAIGIGDLDSFGGGLYLTNFYPKVDMQALASKELKGLFRDRIITGPQKGGQRLQDRDFRAQTSPDGPQFKADHASTDHTELLRDALKREGTLVIADNFVIDFQAWQMAGVRASRNNDIFGNDGLGIVTIDCHQDSDIVFASEFSMALEPSDLVFPKQEFDALAHF